MSSRCAVAECFDVLVLIVCSLQAIEVVSVDNRMGEVQNAAV